MSDKTGTIDGKPCPKCGCNQWVEVDVPTDGGERTTDRCHHCGFDGYGTGWDGSTGLDWYGQNSAAAVAGSADVFHDDLPEAPAMHAMPVAKTEQQVPASNTTVKPTGIATTVAEAEHFRKLNEAFEFAPVWQRFNERGEWVSYALEGFSLFRRQVWWRLLANMVPLPAQGYGRYSTATAFDGWACIYLCSHSTADWMHLLPTPAQFAETITAWAEKNMPEETWIEATNLAWLMDEVAERTAVRLPRRPGGRPGN